MVHWTILCKNSKTAAHESNFTRAYHIEISWATLILGAHARLRLTKHEGLKCSQETCRHGWLKQGGGEQFDVSICSKRLMMMFVWGVGRTVTEEPFLLDAVMQLSIDWFFNMLSSYPLIDWFNIKLPMRMKSAIDEDCPPILSGVEPTRAFWSWT